MTRVISFELNEINFNFIRRFIAEVASLFGKIVEIVCDDVEAPQSMKVA